MLRRNRTEAGARSPVARNGGPNSSPGPHSPHFCMDSAGSGPNAVESWTPRNRAEAGAKSRASQGF
eukprot:10865613-Alexandrium_andersonii.AAC.1